MENAERSEPLGTPEEGGNGAASRAEGRLHVITDKARERAETYAGAAQERIEAQRDKVASNLDTAASRLRQKADAAGPLGHKAGELAAVRIEKAASYLHEHESKEIAGDVEQYIRQHPIRSVVIAAIIGFFLGKLFG